MNGQQPVGVLTFDLSVSYVMILYFDELIPWRQHPLASMSPACRMVLLICQA